MRTHSPRPRLLVVLASIAAMVAVTASVLAAPTAAQADTPIGRSVSLRPTSSTAPTPAQQVTSIDVTQDVGAATLTAVAHFAAPPTSAQNAYVLVLLGESSGSSCSADVIIAAASATDEALGDDYSSGSDRSIPVTRQLTGSDLTITSAGDAASGSATYDCATAKVQEPGSGKVFASFSSQELSEQFAPVPPPAPAAPAAPALSLDRGKPVQGAAKGKWTTVEVDVTNGGDGPATNVVLVPSGKGLSFANTSVPVGTIGDNDDVTNVKVKVKLKGSSSHTLTITATADGGYTASAKVTIARKAAAKKLHSLVGHYYWGTDTNLSQGWDNRGVMFADPKWAYVGFPKSGVPHCSAGVKYCKRYSYNPKTGVVKVGSSKGKVTTVGLELAKKYYSPLTLPKKNATFDVELQHNGFSGCGGSVSCITWTDSLILAKDHKFVRTSNTLSSFGAGYGGSESWFTAVGPDKRGTYAVLSKGRIKFSYEDGTTKVETIGVELDIRGTASPSGEGLLLGSTNFYR